MLSAVSFPAVFFAAIIGVIIFIALSAILLEPREWGGRNDGAPL
jgi:hypothetical protein